MDEEGGDGPLPPGNRGGTVGNRALSTPPCVFDRCEKGRTAMSANRYRGFCQAGMLALAVTALWSAPALALDPYDAPVIECIGATENSITLKICGGADTGAPAGLSLHWMTLADFENNGNQWLDGSDPRLCKMSLSGQPSLRHPGKSRWELLAGECEEVEIGDLNFDETGVSGQNCALDGLECGTTYVFRAFAHAGRRMGRSPWTANLVCSTLDCPARDCTYSQGHYKTHGPAGCVTGNNTNMWPATSLTLGTVNYSATQLCSIFNKPAQGNGLTSLAHQLIAAKFNVLLFTGPTCEAAATAIAQADALIGSKVVQPVGTGSIPPGQTGALTTTLTLFNTGGLVGCPSHCPSERPSGTSDYVPTEASSWGHLKSLYR